MGKVVQLKARGKARVVQLAQSSECFLAVQRIEGCIEAVHIEFRGALAAVPSLKNSKIPGRNFPNPETTAKLEAMTRLFQIEAREYGTLQFGAEERVHVLVICGKRPVRFDKDNVMTTIRDWLEPQAKQKGASVIRRRWGIGVVKDDYFITGYAVRGADIGREDATTTIIVRPWTSVREKAAELVAAHYLV